MPTKSQLVSFALLATLTTATIPNANAGVAITYFSTPSLIALRPALIGTLSLGVAGHFADKMSPFWIAVALSVFYLEKDSNQIKFAPLSPEVASQLNISSSERESYNADLENINLANEELNFALTTAPEQDSSAVSEFKNQFSKNTLNAIGKILLIKGDN